MSAIFSLIFLAVSCTILTLTVLPVSGDLLFPGHNYTFQSNMPASYCELDMISLHIIFIPVLNIYLNFRF